MFGSNEKEFGRQFGAGFEDGAEAGVGAVGSRWDVGVVEDLRGFEEDVGGAIAGGLVFAFVGAAEVGDGVPEEEAFEFSLEFWGGGRGEGQVSSSREAGEDDVGLIGGEVGVGEDFENKV